MERLEKLCISGELTYPNVRAKSSAVASSRASGRRYTLAPRCLTGGCLPCRGTDACARSGRVCESRYDGGKRAAGGTRISAGKSRTKHTGEDVRAIEEESNHEAALKGGHSAGRGLISLRIDSGLQWPLRCQRPVE